MPTPLKKGYKQLIAAAKAEIETLSVEEALALHGNPDVLFVDLRDVREVKHEGRIPGSLHAPRGMLEFWVDPESPYHKKVFASGKRFIFHCALDWRSALATQTMQEMGLDNVCHLGGGFEAWKKAGGVVEAKT